MEPDTTSALAEGALVSRAFEHNGSIATLDDWFDPARLRDDYVPTGFRGYAVKTRAIKGHKFGLKLKPDEKKALIAFLLTLERKLVSWPELWMQSLLVAPETRARQPGPVRLTSLHLFASH